MPNGMKKVEEVSVPKSPLNKDIIIGQRSTAIDESIALLQAIETEEFAKLGDDDQNSLFGHVYTLFDSIQATNRRIRIMERNEYLQSQGAQE